MILRIALLVLLPLASVLVPGRSVLAVQDDPECFRWRRAFVGMPRATLVIRASAGQRHVTHGSFSFPIALPKQ